MTTVRIAINEPEEAEDHVSSVHNTAVLIVGSVASVGRLAAVAMKKSGVKNAVDNHSIPTQSKEDHHGSQHN